MKHQKTLLAIIAALVIASPVLVQGAQHAFTHPSSLPKQASDNARRALADRGTHGHEENETGEHDDNESATGAAHEHDDNETGTVHEHEDNETGTIHEHDDNETEHESITVDNNHEENVTAGHCVQNDSILNIPLSVAPGTTTHIVVPLVTSQVIAIIEGC